MSKYKKLVLQTAIAAGAVVLSYAGAAAEPADLELSSGMKLTLDGRQITVQPGDFAADDRDVNISAPSTLLVDVSPTQTVVVDIHTKSLTNRLEQWRQLMFKSIASNPGFLKARIQQTSITTLQAPHSVPKDSETNAEILAPYALTATAVELADKRFAEVLQLNLPELDKNRISQIKIPVRTMRIDRLVQDSNSKVLLVKGEPSVFTAIPPEVPANTIPLATIVVRPGDGAIAAGDVRPFKAIATVASMYETQNQKALARTREKISVGQPIKIAFVGDSITAGGFVADPNKSFPLQLLAKLSSQGKFAWSNFGVSGANITQSPAAFDAAIANKPDLIIVEFANDYTAAKGLIEPAWQSIADKVKARGVEMLICIPPEPATDKQAPETAINTQLASFLRSFAAANSLGVADVAKHWELCKLSDIDPTLMRMDYIHPNEYGHRAFADELYESIIPAHPVVRQHAAGQASIPL